VVGAAGFTASALLPPDSYTSRYGALIVAASGAFACIPPMLGWLTSNVFSTAAVGLAVAINVSFGAGLGQMPGVWIYKSEEAKAGFPTGHWVNAGMLYFVAVGAVVLRLYSWLSAVSSLGLGCCVSPLQLDRSVNVIGSGPRVIIAKRVVNKLRAPT
jgi:hypothetical protein